MKNSKNFKRGNFNPSRNKPVSSEKQKSNVMGLSEGDYFKGFGKIIRRSVPGPVIFIVSDGYGCIEAVIKDSDFKEGDVVELSGEVRERAGKIQIEIEKIFPAQKDFGLLFEKNSEPVRVDFSIKSQRLEKLKPYFIKIAKRIRRALLENQPILIRHHSDADGIIAGLAIEQSSKKFIKKIGLDPEYVVYRSPSKAPFYEISDVFRDVILSERLRQFEQKKPLIIVLDNGSTPEDVLGLKTLFSLGFEVIVVDHHNPIVIENKKTLVDEYLSLHLNPYKEGLDSQTCAGMLAYELARFICEDYESKTFPAVAGISDRCLIEETDEYIKNSGESRVFLEKIGIAIDFISYHIRFNPGKGLFEELFQNNEFVETINEEVRKGFETQLQSTMPYLRTKEIEGVVFSYIDLEKYTVRFKYPAPGKVTGAIHDILATEKETLPLITLGCLTDMIIIRATKPILPVSEIIKTLKKDLPQANIDGGGHDCAGSIKFVSAHFTEVLENIKNQVKNIHYLEKNQEE
ncbi:MAG: hypothetical protein Q8O39_02265 [bacterium]|nr:hypothetical protein [bacterium]